MKYDIFFHNDFDGVASAAVMLAFLRSRGDSIERYTPVEFGIKEKWPTYPFKNSPIIVDFPYHPKAVFWFDHHPTAFMKDEWRKKFRPTKFLNWYPAYDSCCHMVLDVLVKEFGFKPPAHLKELARWLDIIDGAKYKSAKQTIDMKEAAIRLRYYIEEFGVSNKTLKTLVNYLASDSINKIVLKKDVAKGIASLLERRERALAFYKPSLKLIGSVVFDDETKNKVFRLRFAPFYFYPKARYGVTVKRKRQGYHITVGVNPWRKGELEFNIGEMLRAYGGGGHKQVGGLEILHSNNAPKILGEILATLNGGITDALKSEMKGVPALKSARAKI